MLDPPAHMDPPAILILDFGQPIWIISHFNIRLQSAYPDPPAILILSSGQPIWIYQPF
jgi:hypothetical protein